MRLRVDTERITPSFLIDLLQTNALRPQMLARAKRAINQSSINQQDIKALQIPLPPLSLQRAFVAKATTAQGIAKLQASAMMKAQPAFDALLHKAFAA